MNKFFNNIFKKFDMIFVNEKSYVGRNISVRNNRIIINGVDVTPKDTLKVDIRVDGNIEVVDVDCCDKIDVTGYVKSLRATSSDIKCGDVKNGIVITSGNVNCDSVVGNIKTTSGEVKTRGNVSGSIETMSGNVNCENVGGDIKTTSGDINYKK